MLLFPLSVLLIYILLSPPPTVFFLVVSVMGAAIPVPKYGPNPPHTLVDEIHAKYVAALKKLYDSNMAEFCHPTDFYGKSIAAQPLKIVA